MSLKVEEVLSYALGGPVPESFARRILQLRRSWDPEFVRQLEAFAYEFRPDLAVWELQVGPDGALLERRLPLLSGD